MQANRHRSSGSISGTIQTDGRVSLGMTTQGANADALLEDVPYCKVTSGESELNGTISRGALRVSARFYAACPDSSGRTFPAVRVFSFVGHR